MWLAEGFYRGAMLLIGIVFLVGMAVGIALAKVVPWLMTHLKIEWVS